MMRLQGDVLDDASKDDGNVVRTLHSEERSTYSPPRPQFHSVSSEDSSSRPCMRECWAQTLQNAVSLFRWTCAGEKRLTESVPVVPVRPEYFPLVCVADGLHV